MLVRELIAHLQEQPQDVEVILEVFDTEYWHVADVDGAIIEDLEATRMCWDYEGNEVNAVRICN